MRRADMIDRGRRFSKAGSKPNTITITNTQSNVAITLRDDSNQQALEWKCTDAATGVTDVRTSSTSGSITITWSSALGGTATCKVPVGNQTLLYCVSDSVTSVTMKNSSKWSNFEDIRLFSNYPFTEFTGLQDWPNLWRLDVSGSDVNIPSFDWPSMEYLSIAGSLSTIAGGFVLRDWPNLTDFICSYSRMEHITIPATWTKLQNIDVSYNREISGQTLTLCDLPELLELKAGYSQWEHIDIGYELPKVENIDLQAGGNPTVPEYELTTSPTWVNLKAFSIGAYRIHTIPTYPEWVSMERLTPVSSWYCTDIVVHPEWVNFDYFAGRQMSSLKDATVIDQIYINIDASGSQSGPTKAIDLRLAAYADDVNRSAAAITAKNNLIAKGWTFLT